MFERIGVRGKMIDANLYFQVGSQSRAAGFFRRPRRPQTTGVVKADTAPPNNLSRDVIEKSIADNGFQLYKLKGDK
jgi:hypothetical protein